MESTDNVLEDTVAQNQSKNSEWNIQDMTANNRSQNVSEICASDVLAMSAKTSLSVLESLVRAAQQESQDKTPVQISQIVVVRIDKKQQSDNSVVRERCARCKKELTEEDLNAAKDEVSKSVPLHEPEQQEAAASAKSQAIKMGVLDESKRVFWNYFFLNDEEFRYIPIKEILKAAEEALLKRKKWKHCLAFETFKASLKAWNVKRHKNQHLEYLAEWYVGSYHKITPEEVKDDGTRDDELATHWRALVEESKGKEGNAISQLKYAIEKMKEKDKK